MAAEHAQIVMAKSDSGLHIALHPLVLLTISDYLTRHTLRQFKQPIVGALLGQQNGRETTVEHAFECKVMSSDDTLLDAEWFETRLQLMKDVHKEPQLDLVGWYTTMPTSGPQQHHMPIQKQLSNFYPECSLLLGFHPTSVLDGAVGGKLPLTIWETNIEPLKASGPEAMKDDSPDVKVTYKEVPYTVETGEAEMISVDSVARGGGNATAINATSSTDDKASSAAKGKGKVPEKVATQSGLSREDEERIASLTAKVNAIKMLRSRVSLLKTYLEQLPPQYIKGEAYNAATAAEAGHSPVDQNILRSIQALLNRLTLLVPSNTTAFNEELLKEQNDVSLVNLLNTMTESIQDARKAGRKFQVIEQNKPRAKPTVGGFDAQGFSGAGDLL